MERIQIVFSNPKNRTTLATKVLPHILPFKSLINGDNADTKTRRHAHTTTALRGKIFFINSLILAARSRFFRKLFSNGMLGYGQKLVTLRIGTSEEDSLIDLLKYAYSNNLPTTLHALLDLLVIADKFEVASCSRDCTQLLQNMPMTCESASLYLDLLPSLQTYPRVEPIIDAAKQFLVSHFKDFEQCNEEMLNLSLAGIQVVLSSDDLQVASEYVVFDSVLTWAHKQYPDLEERREILKTHLLDLIRFPFMTIPQLTEKVQTCSEIDPELAKQIVLRALCFKAETPHRKRCLATVEVNLPSPFKYEVAIRLNPSVEFVSWTRGSYAFMTEQVGVLNLIDVRWTGYMSGDNSYFINDVQYVRVELTLH